MRVTRKRREEYITRSMEIAVKLKEISNKI